ncbi:MAG: hypothetical protein MZU97_24605 [Bacillus subtilis]|nr:hypothetical protein [Bacillus subtilis]
MGRPSTFDAPHLRQQFPAPPRLRTRRHEAGAIFGRTCLAQIIGQPSPVREAIINNVGGIRIDGSNATIIGHKQGEFVADRNKIVRVWSDHGAWGFVTTDMYVHRTGDRRCLFRTANVFQRQIHPLYQTNRFHGIATPMDSA